MSGPVLLQCSVSGYSGAAVTLLGAMDAGTGAVLVTADKKDGDAYTPLRKKPQFAFVANSTAAQGRDVLFTDEHLRDAIHTYFDFKARGLVRLDNSVAKHNADTRIEPDGVDERGRKYRLAEDITCGQVAVLVLCWFARRQQQVIGTVDAFEDIFDVYRAVSVGLPDEGDDF